MRLIQALVLGSSILAGGAALASDKPSTQQDTHKVKKPAAKPAAKTVAKPTDKPAKPVKGKKAKKNRKDLPGGDGDSDGASDDPTPMSDGTIPPGRPKDDPIPAGPLPRPAPQPPAPPPTKQPGGDGPP